MKWNQLRKKALENLHPLFQGKLDFQYTAYRGGAEHKVLTFIYNKEALFNLAGEYRNWPVECKSMKKLNDEFGESLEVIDKIIGGKTEKEIIDPYDLKDALYDVFNVFSIEEALNGENDLVKMVVLLDKRCGKRTFEKLDYSTNEHKLLRIIYNLRKELEK